MRGVEGSEGRWSVWNIFIRGCMNYHEHIIGAIESTARESHPSIREAPRVLLSARDYTRVLLAAAAVPFALPREPPPRARYRIYPPATRRLNARAHSCPRVF